MSTFLFIYNANSGTLNTIFDVGHKIFSPSTYQCNLCALTYDTFSENKQWKQFREQGGINMEFYHIDEFEKKFPNTTFEFPVILKKDNENVLEIFMSKKELDLMKSLDDLIKHIENGFLPLKE